MLSVVIKVLIEALMPLHIDLSWEMGILPSIGVEPSNISTFLRDNMSTTTVNVDFIAIARDIAQESCLRIPMTEDKHISQRQGIFTAANIVKKMCNIPGDLKEGSTKLILFCAIVVELAADILARNPRIDISKFTRYVLAAPRSSHSHCYQSLVVLLRVYEEIEIIMNILKSTTSDDSESEVEMIETQKSDLIDALAYVRLSHPAEICISTH